MAHNQILPFTRKFKMLSYVRHVMSLVGNLSAAARLYEKSHLKRLTVGEYMGRGQSPKSPEC